MRHLQDIFINLYYGSMSMKVNEIPIKITMSYFSTFKFEMGVGIYSVKYVTHELSYLNLKYKKKINKKLIFSSNRTRENLKTRIISGMGIKD